MDKLASSTEESSTERRKLLFVVNVDHFFLSHRLPIALEAMKQGYSVHIATTLTDRLEDLQSHDITVHPLSLKRSDTGLWGLMKSFREMLGIFRKVHPDVTHLVTIKPVLLGGLAARVARLPSVVAAISGLGFVFLESGFMAACRRIAVGFFYAIALGHKNIVVVFQNHDDRQVVTKMSGISDSKIRMIRGSGVDLQDYPYHPLPDSTPVVVLAARMLKDKGVQEFVEAARLLQTDEFRPKNGVRCVLVGEPDPGNRASLTQEELDAWEEEGVVELWGKRSDMADVLAAAHVVVLPSYREGLPKVLIEAASCGRAVVATDVPGCRDAIEPDVTGFLVPVKEARPIAEALKKLLDDEDLCKEMGRRGRKLAEEVFDVRLVVKSHLEIYSELTSSSSTA